MPITSGPLQSTAPAAGVGGGSNPLNFSAIGMPNLDPSKLQMDPTGVINTLANNAPPSLTSLLMPLYSQLFSSQGGALKQQADLSGQQGVAAAQSAAQQRGLTGSSIEAGAMQGARSSAENAYTQGYASLLGNYVNQYAGAAGQDVSNQQNYFSNLAQALGQGYNSKIQQQQFAEQLAAGLKASSDQSRATMWGGALGGAGAAISGIFSDIRLKKNIKKIGTEYGLNVYKFEYDGDKGIKLPKGDFIGFMAHHVADKYPEAVHVIKGYLAIDYSKLAEVAIA